MTAIELGVNIDHVATLRQARKGVEPDPVWAVAAAEMGGADAITVHLREDRRHIADRDLRLIRQVVSTKLNLEMGSSDEIARIALEVMPDQITLVPEKRQELTTEGGLNVAAEFDRLAPAVEKFKALGVKVSLFVDPETEQIRSSQQVGAECIELHTGRYANARGDEIARQLAELANGAELAAEIGLRVHAGHGLNYRNVGAVAAIPQVVELNIGHSIISRAIFVGLETAVRRMKEAIWQARGAEGR